MKQHFFSQSQSNQGFTVLEMLMTIMIVGILSAIAAPSWLNFINQQRLSTAQNELYRAMSQAKSNATRDKRTWQVSFRENNQVLQWAIHPKTTVPDDANWQNLDAKIRLDEDNTTFRKDSSSSEYEVKATQFNYLGAIDGQQALGRITITTEYSNQMKRCVFLSTLIGGMRIDRNQDCE